MNRMFPRMDWYAASAKRGKLRLSRHTVPCAPESLRGLKVVFGSDFHLLPDVSPEPMVERLMQEKPDLILLGGDYSDTRKQALRLFDAFRALHAPLGIYAARGNNDVEAFGGSPAPLAKAMKVFGAKLLVGESVDVGGLSIGGMDEYKYGPPAYDGLFKGRCGYRILLSHYPILPDAAPENMPDLMLSGHTHGGQFNAFGLNPYSIGFERIGDKKCLSPAMVSGFERIGTTFLLTSKGVGTSRIHIRIGVRPEIHLLEFNC